ncbi:MAG: hypothetical protein R3E42_09590 [Burkholderiaceae bacterium]
MGAGFKASIRSRDFWASSWWSVFAILRAAVPQFTERAPFYRRSDPQGRRERFHFGGEDISLESGRHGDLGSSQPAEFTVVGNAQGDPGVAVV